MLVVFLAIIFVAIGIGGIILWLERLDKESKNERWRMGKQHAHIVKRKLGNKVSIVLFTFQVIYQYSDIVTAHEHYFHYPEPARSAVSNMFIFGLELLNFSPPEVSVAVLLPQPSLIIARAAFAFV